MTWLKTLAVSAVLLSAASAYAEGPARLVPLIAQGDRYFTLQWQGGAQNGRPMVQGSIYNEYGFAAQKVRLLVDSLDDSGAVTAQTIAYVPHDLTPGTRYYFETAVPAPAASYRVLVFQWEWVQAGGGEPR